MENFKYFIIGFSHSILSLTLMIFYFQFRPDDFIIFHDIFVILSILSLNNISLNVTFSIIKIADKLDVDNNY